MSGPRLGSYIAHADSQRVCQMYSLGMNSLHISSGRQTEQYWYEVVRGQEKVRVLNSLRMFTGQMGINVKATLIAWVKTWRHGTVFKRHK
ncbi:hypothetical protein SCLCIDRAFT_1208731 [Scleroderma citrinum Foug A]|uniref:Uncharacterized protein n=1 Tax=Scleroderma citrinum Foug A TaxID=1036808 RepID=A0A0C3EMA3_9AGAM|nr:hypothetical protein SCLCIDRAFT_1208731 [Scleroderma citrinum Foug A]